MKKSKSAIPLRLITRFSFFLKSELKIYLMTYSIWVSYEIELVYTRKLAFVAGS